MSMNAQEKMELMAKRGSHEDPEVDTMDYVDTLKCDTTDDGLYCEALDGGTLPNLGLGELDEVKASHVDWARMTLTQKQEDSFDSYFRGSAYCGTVDVDVEHGPDRRELVCVDPSKR